MCTKQLECDIITIKGGKKMKIIRIIKKFLECILMELLILIVFPIILVAFGFDVDIIIDGSIIIAIIAPFVFFWVNRESKIEKRELKRHEKLEVIKEKTRKKMEVIKKVRCEKFENENEERKNFIMENEIEIIKGKVNKKLSDYNKNLSKIFAIFLVLIIISLPFLAVEDEEMFWIFLCVGRS